MAKDPYQYFRVEARELLDGLTQGVLQLEKSPSLPEVVARLLRLAHTLKGAARVVKQPEIAERAHRFEGILTAHRESALPLSKAQGSELLLLLDEIGSRLADISSPAPLRGDSTAATYPARLSAEEPLETLRVEMREMDALLHTLTEAGVQLGAVRKGLGGADRLRDASSLLLDLLAVRPVENRAAAASGMARARSLAQELRNSLDHFQRSLVVDLERVDGAFVEMLDVAHRLRLVPAQTVFASLAGSVRDAAQTLGKRVAFDASGGEVRLDANVLVSLRDALMHVVRNAVAHGMEPEAERIALGKPPTGQVRLEVLRRGSRVAFVCTDDGRGIDVEAVRTAAIARGLLPAAAAKALSGEQVIGLFGSVGAVGLTTAKTVTELSGRGIGLDVVRATLSQLKGEMHIRSEPGRGVRVEVQVPVAIAALQGLVVEADGARVAIPLDAVQQTLRVRDEEVARSAQGDSILYAGKVIPFLALDLLLRRSVGPNYGSRGRPGVWSAVVVQAGGRCAALGVDRLLGAANIVMRALPRVVEADAVVAGASLDAQGSPQLVLDPAGLVAAAERSRGETLHAGAQAQRAPILVIDDSLTTRMLEQSILEAAGYQVELAVSAEDALIKAQDHRYSLFIVDVEMPGMDGFGFVAQTRADPVQRDIPAILVTSLDAVEHRLRGQQVGASAYIIKGEFDQGQLLQTIRKLIG